MPRFRWHSVLVTAALLIVFLSGAAYAAPTSHSASVSSPDASAVDTTSVARSSAGRVRTVTYPGQGIEIWRNSGQLGRLRATSPDFRMFVKRRLDKLFSQVKNPACGRSALITVNRWRSDGYAIASEGVYARSGDPDSCIQGGWTALYVKTSRGWRVATGFQETPAECAPLRRWKFPVAIAGTSCRQADFNAVAYPNATTALRSAAANFNAVLAEATGGVRKPTPGDGLSDEKFAWLVGVLSGRQASARDCRVVDNAWITCGVTLDGEPSMMFGDLAPAIPFYDARRYHGWTVSYVSWSD